MALGVPVKSPDHLDVRHYKGGRSSAIGTGRLYPKNTLKKGKGVPRQAELALGVPGRLRPRIFLTLGTTRVVDRQPNAPAAFTPEEIPGTRFQRLSRPQGTWFCRKEPRKKSQVTPPGIDPGTVRLVAQRLNHYATPGPRYFEYVSQMFHYILTTVTGIFTRRPMYIHIPR